MTFLDFERLQLDNIDPEKSRRIERAKRDFWFFASYYLSEFFSEEPAPYQRVLVDIINKERVEKDHIEALKR